MNRVECTVPWLGWFHVIKWILISIGGQSVCLKMFGVNLITSTCILTSNGGQYFITSSLCILISNSGVDFITCILISNGGQYFSILISNGGQYFRTSISISNGGQYFKSDSELMYLNFKWGPSSIAFTVSRPGTRSSRNMSHANSRHFLPWKGSQWFQETLVFGEMPGHHILVYLQIWRIAVKKYVKCPGAVVGISTGYYNFNPGLINPVWLITQTIVISLRW